MKRKYKKIFSVDRLSSLSPWGLFTSMYTVVNLRTGSISFDEVSFFPGLLHGPPSSKAARGYSADI